MRHTYIVLAGTLPIAAWAPTATAQSDQRIVMPLTDPTRPAVVEVTLVQGDISVRAYDGQEVLISFDGADGLDLDRSPRERGNLRRIPSSSLGLLMEEADNTVTISAEWASVDVDLDIAVPRMTSVHARTVNNGDVEVVGVYGEHEFANVNGDVTAMDIAGSAVANTTNGDIEITFTEIAPDKAMSFASFNGDVDVGFPRDLAAELRIGGSRHGDIWTDFEFELQRQEVDVDRRDGMRRNRVRVARELRATIGGGGPVIQFRTVNGEIVIRQYPYL